MSSGVLDRVRLFRRLDEPATRIAVLSAPSGFGKTTLVRSWVASLQDPAASVVWVPLTATIGDEREFWTRVGTALLRFGVTDDPVMPELLMRGDDPVTVIGSALAGSSTRVVLVIDAYEQVHAEGVDSVLADLVAADPMLRVVLTARGGTSFSTPSGRLGAGVDVLDETDLGFTLEETEAVVAAAGLSGGDRTAAAVQSDTGGYPLAVRAVVLGMRSGLGAGSKIADWRSAVAEVVLDQVPASARSFLLETAVAPYFDESLASRLIPGDDVPRMIGALARAGLGRWIPYSPKRMVFQYVDVVRDAVRATAVLDEVGYQRACGLSAAWLRDLGEDEAALELAIAGRRFDIATAVTRQIILRDPQSYMTDLLGAYLAELPSGVLSRFPVLALARGLGALTSVATRGGAPEWLHLAARRPVSTDPSLSAGERFFDHTVKVVSLRLVGKFAEAAVLAQQTLALDRPDLGVSDGLVELRPIALRHLAYTLLQAGAVDSAADAMSRAVTASTQPWSRNQTLSYAAGILAIDGRRYDADRTLALMDPDEWGPGEEFEYVNGLGRIASALSRVDELDAEAAIQVYDGCERLLSTAEFWPFINWTLGMARLGLGEAAPEAGRIEAQLRARPRPPGTGANLGTASLHGLLAILWLAGGQPTKAAVHLEAPGRYPGQLAPAVLLQHLMIGDVSEAIGRLTSLLGGAGHTNRSRAACLTLGAAAALRVRNEPLALSLLQRAVSLHLAHGARAHLWWVPDLDLADLRHLAKVAGDDRSSAYLQCDAPIPIGLGDSIEPLTERERVVLEAMMRLRTRPQIAADLHVSTNTVKTQLQSIYRKLGVTSRESAIERAIELDLLAAP